MVGRTRCTAWGSKHASGGIAPALSAIGEEAGGVTLKGFPMTLCYVNSFPAQITVPIVVAVTALGGDGLRPGQGHHRDDSLEDTESEHLFPRPFLKVNPLLQAR
jgi:hypothetical protein